MKRVAVFSALLWSFLAPNQSQGYLFIERAVNEWVAVIHSGDKVVYQPCSAQRIVQENYPADPAEFQKQCAATSKESAFSHSATSFYSNINAIYAIPTTMVPENEAISALTDWGIRSESEYRNGQTADSEDQIDKIAGQLQASYDDILQYLEPETHESFFFDNHRQFALTSSVISAFTPIYSDGKTAVRIAAKFKVGSEDGCGPRWVLASAATLYDLFSGPQGGKNLRDWIVAKQGQQASTNLDLFTWREWNEQKTTRDYQVGYISHTDFLEFTLSAQNVETLIQNRSSLERTQSWETVALSEIPAGELLKPAETGGTYVRNGYRYQRPSKSYVGLCVKRQFGLNSDLAPFLDGTIDLKQLAARYGVTVDIFSRKVINDASLEQILAPMLALQSSISEKDFEKLLKARLDTLFGVGLPTYEKLEQEAIAAEQRRTKAAAEAAALEKRLAHEAEQRLIASLRSESAAADQAFKRYKESGSALELEVLNDTGYDMKVYLAAKWNEWDWVTIGVWTVGAWQSDVLYRGRMLSGDIYYHASSPAGNWGSDAEFVIGGPGGVSVRASGREPIIWGERKVTFSKWKNKNNRVRLHE